MKEINKKKRGRRPAFFLAAILTGCFVLTGWADDLKDIKNKMESIRSIEADFTQEKYLEILNAPLISKGKFYFSAPQSLRWEYKTPVRSILLMKDENLRRYAETTSGMVEEKSQGLEAIRVFLQNISLWMKGEFDTNPDLEAELASGNMILLRPESRSVSEFVRKIEIQFAETSGVIDAVTIYEDASSYTIIRFHDTKINQTIDGEIFEKISPDG